MGGCLYLAEMGSTLVCLANFSAHQAKLHSQGMPMARQKGPEVRQCTVGHLDFSGEKLLKLNSRVWAKTSVDTTVPIGYGDLGYSGRAGYSDLNHNGT